MPRRTFLQQLSVIAGGALTTRVAETQARAKRLTRVGIDGERFLIPGRVSMPTRQLGHQHATEEGVFRSGEGDHGNARLIVPALTEFAGTRQVSSVPLLSLRRHVRHLVGTIFATRET